MPGRSVNTRFSFREAIRGNDSIPRSVPRVPVRSPQKVQTLWRKRSVISSSPLLAGEEQQPSDSSLGSHRDCFHLSFVVRHDPFSWIFRLYLSANRLGSSLGPHHNEILNDSPFTPCGLPEITFETKLDAGDLPCSLSSRQPDQSLVVGRHLYGCNCVGRLALRRKYLVRISLPFSNADGGWLPRPVANRRRRFSLHSFDGSLRPFSVDHAAWYL